LTVPLSTQLGLADRPGEIAGLGPVDPDAATCDFEHNIPFEHGGITCLCNGGPKCRHEHRLKQHPRWNCEQITPGTFRWTAPSGRQYTTEPTRYPI